MLSMNCSVFFNCETLPFARKNVIILSWIRMRRDDGRLWRCKREWNGDGSGWE